MAYDLSFSEAFFTGEEELGITDYPTSILEALENTDHDWRLSVARDVFEMESGTAEIWVTTECFVDDMLSQIRMVNTCSNLSTPVRVWIDEEGWYTLDVYDKED